MEMYKDLPVIEFANQEEWRKWLHAHHTQPAGIWIKFAKKGTGVTTASYDEALDAALCYGWIDGQTQRFDATYYLQKFTPRRAKSIWSKRNVTKVAKLAAAGKIQPAGQAAIDAAKADGRWEQAYDSFSNSVIPDDFQAALVANPKAKAFYATLNKTNTYAILWRIQTAKKPETRARRIETLIAMLNSEEKIH